jgi:hypothetical protein
VILTHINLVVKNNLKKNKLAFVEVINLSDFKLTLTAFHETTITLLSEYKYYTTYCKEILGDVKK